MEIKIYSQDGTLKLTASPGSGGQCVKQLQGDSELSLSFDYFSYVALDVNDYVDFCGDRYWLLEQYRPKEVSTIQWRYDVKLYGIESLIKRYLVIEHTDGDANPVFRLTAPASQHMRMIVECLNNATGTTDWQLGTVLTTGNITIDYTGKYCDEGLRELAEAANTEYWFSGDNGKTLNLCRCERGETIELKYGVGLISLERDVADNAKFYTRLYPVGSSRNINPETYGHTRLQLPNNQKYVDLDIARYGVIDHYEQDAFAGIYPRYIGTVSTVRVEDRTDEDGTEFKVYFIKDASLPFNPNNFLLPNEKIRISFQTGDLQGLGETDDHYFEADYNSTTGEFEIINIWTDGEQLPRPGLEPETGNSYIPWNISMPQTYITRAEQELAAAVSSYNQAHFVDNSVYRGTTNHVWIEADQTRNIYIGRLVKLVSDQYFPGTGYRNSRIVKITRRLDLPSQMELEISDAVSTGTLTKINDDIRGVWDFVKGLETDDNGKWLSKRHNDTAQGLIRFIRGLQVGERFVTGLLGEGGIFRKEADGTTYIEADKLYIRMKAYFDSVEIRDYRHSAGNRIASLAGAKCCRVDWIDASGKSLKQTSENLASTVLFRCYFRGSDGEDEVRNNFIVGDLAYCHITTVETEDDSPIAKGLNMTHYWRLIVGRNAHGTLTDDGEHWIDLSNRVSETVTIGGTSYTRKGYQPGSDVPAAQNDIIHLGNIRDTDRQGAIIEFVTGADAPSYQIFQGIGSDVSNPYSLEGKNYVRFGYDSESGGAQVFIGNPDGSTYLWYHNVTEGGVTHPKLEIKAEVSLSSTFGGKSFEELVVEYAPEGWTEEEINQLIVDETDPLFSDIETALDTIQRQVDGSISTWFYDGTPTLNNLPASQWDTADKKNEHLGDLYYDNLTGYGYRFKYDETSRQWSWVRITDVDVTKALADAAKAQDTADHKRRVFVVQPTPPYDQGDLWVNATYPSGNTETNAAQNKYYNDVLRCKTAKASGTTFAIADWELASKYTDDTAFNNFFANTYQPFVRQIQSQVDGKAETWYQSTDPSAAWNTSALKQAHVGDIWHNTSSATVSGVEAGQDAIWSGSDWKPSTVPQEVYDKIDGKADIFVSKPSTYNVNDMWIIESGLASGDMPSGCVVGDIVISSAARKNSYTKSDWKKKDRYTDDSSLIAFIGGYTGTAQELQNQIDKKAETWYQATNPASASGWVAEDHVGDLWYCTADISGTSYKAGTTWYYKDNGASASPRYAWVQQDIPDAVFDMIDGKAQIFVSQPSNYHAKDLWILAADTTVNGVACKQGEVLVSSADSTTYNQAHWSRKLRYTDDSALNTFLNGYAGTLTGIINSITNAQNTANAAQQSADDANALAATANYLKQAFLDNTGQAQTTDITGGLVLSTIVALRDANKKVWSGISGAYQAQETGTGYKGHGIAAWYGGGMIDGEVSASSSNAAKSLFRFDGSGYVANKNISWDNDGNVTIQGYSINATTLKSNGSAVATESMLANYVTIATAQTITGAKTFGTADGSYIQIGAVRIVYDATNNALKIVGSNGSSAANLYATGSVSALGAGSGGSSGSGDVTWALLASSSDTRQIALSHLTGALSSYATQSWVQQQISGYTPSSSTRNIVANGVSYTVTSPYNTDINLDSTYLKLSATEQRITSAINSMNIGVIQLYRTGASGNWCYLGFANNDSDGNLQELGQIGFETRGVLKLKNSPYSYKIWHEGNDGSGSGLDADLLDGQHGSYYATASSLGNYLPLSGGTLTGNLLVSTAAGIEPRIGVYQDGYAPIYLASGSTTKNRGLYSAELGWLCGWDKNNVAFFNGNATSATQLQTSRTIWGQSFNGTANVSGDMSSVGSIDNILNFKTNGIHTKLNIEELALTVNGTHLFVASQSNDYANSRPLILQYGYGNVGIGATAPAYKLDVNGTFRASGNSSIGGTFGVSGATTLSSTLGVTGATTLSSTLSVSGLLTASGGITIPSGKTLKIGDAELSWDATNQGIKVTKGLYSQTFISALGVGSSGSSGSGDVTWALLASSSDTRQIALSHLTNALSSYATQSWVNSQIAGMSTSLAGLSDVNVSGVTSGQYLKFNGQKWVADRPSSGTTSTRDFVIGGVSYTVTSPYTTNVNLDNVYLKSTTAASTYLPLTGGTLTGVGNVLSLKNSSGGNIGLIFDRSGNTSWSITAKSGNLFFVDEYSSTEVFKLTESSQGAQGYINGNAIIHSGNIGSQSVSYATSSGTSASATKLATARTIWGQSFDGSANISGNMSNVGFINSILGLGNGINAKLTVTEVGATINYIDIHVESYNSTQNRPLVFQYGYGNVGVGVEQPAYKLDVSGDVRATNFRGNLVGNASTADLANMIKNNITVTSDSSHDNGIWFNNGTRNVMFGTGSSGSTGIYIRNIGWVVDVNSSGSAFLNGNATSATTASKLSTVSKTAWGQTYWTDGGIPATISGAMTNVTTIDGYVSFTTKQSGNPVLNISTISVSGGTDYISIYVTATNRPLVLQDGAGNVGVGVAQPSYKLHVDGTFRTSGNSSIGGTLEVSGATTLSSTLGVTGATTLSSTLSVTGTTTVQSIEIGHTNEINATGSNTLYLQYRNTGNLVLCNNGKNVGIGTSPSYKLHVAGDVYATGGVTCLSDIREKNILRPTEITVEQIAKMPSIVYRWKDNGDDHDEHVGSIAQDWQKTLPQVVLTAKDEKKTLSMQYGVAALVSAITIARKVVDHERRIKELENENRKLKKQLKIA